MCRRLLRSSNVNIHGPRKSLENAQYHMISICNVCLLCNYIYETPCRSADMTFARTAARSAAARTAARSAARTANVTGEVFPNSKFHCEAVQL